MMALRRRISTISGARGFTHRVKRWRRQAEEYRTLADCAKSESARETYRLLAEECEHLADRFDETVAAAERDGIPVMPREKPRL
jgi:hypothetical protein